MAAGTRTFGGVMVLSLLAAVPLFYGVYRLGLWIVERE